MHLRDILLIYKVLLYVISIACNGIFYSIGIKKYKYFEY